MRSDIWFWSSMVGLIIVIIVVVFFLMGMGAESEIDGEVVLKVVASSCVLDSDCKLIYSDCGCLAVSANDSRTELESVGECSENECTQRNTVARCENKICVNRTIEDDLVGTGCRENSECVLRAKPYCCGEILEYVDACYSVYSDPEEVFCEGIATCPKMLGLPIRSCICMEGECYGQVIER